MRKHELLRLLSQTVKFALQISRDVLDEEEGATVSLLAQKSVLVL